MGSILRHPEVRTLRRFEILRQFFWIRRDATTTARSSESGDHASWVTVWPAAARSRRSPRPKSVALVKHNGAARRRLPSVPEGRRGDGDEGTPWVATRAAGHRFAVVRARGADVSPRAAPLAIFAGSRRSPSAPGSRSSRATRETSTVRIPALANVAAAVPAPTRSPSPRPAKTSAASPTRGNLFRHADERAGARHERDGEVRVPRRRAEGAGPTPTRGETTAGDRDGLAGERGRDGPSSRAPTRGTVGARHAHTPCISGRRRSNHRAGGWTRTRRVEANAEAARTSPTRRIGHARAADGRTSVRKERRWSASRRATLEADGVVVCARRRRRGGRRGCRRPWRSTRRAIRGRGNTRRRVRPRPRRRRGRGRAGRAIVAWTRARERERAGGGRRWWRATPGSRGGGGRRARARTRNRSVERSVETRETRTRGGLVAGLARESFDPTRRARRGGGRTGIESTTLARRREASSKRRARISAQRAVPNCQKSVPIRPILGGRGRARLILASARHSHLRPEQFAPSPTRAVSRRRRARTRPGAYRALASPPVIRVARRFLSRGRPSVASRGAALGSRDPDWRLRRDPERGAPEDASMDVSSPSRRPSGRRRARPSLLRGAGGVAPHGPAADDLAILDADTFRDDAAQRIHRALQPVGQRPARPPVRHARRRSPRRLRPRRSDAPRPPP